MDFITNGGGRVHSRSEPRWDEAHQGWQWWMEWVQYYTEPGKPPYALLR
jgi:hypothetical protein